MDLWKTLIEAPGRIAKSAAKTYSNTTTAMGELGYKGYSVYKHMANYDKIIVDPNQKLTADERGMDAVGPVSGFRNVAAAGLAPKHPTKPAPVAAKAMPVPQTAKDMQPVVSDVLVDMVLMSTLNQKVAPAKILDKFGKDKVDYFNDKNGEPYIIAIQDPTTGKVRAFERLAIERDIDTTGHPKPDATGFCAAAFAEIKVDPKYKTPTEFTHRKNAKRDLEPSVRTIFQGYQYNFEGSSSPGQTDRGGIPAQMTQVLGFNKKVDAAMQKAGMPENAEVTVTSSSLGNANAMLSSYMWQTHPVLKHRTLGRVITEEPVGAAIAARQIATLTTALEQSAGRTTNIETELNKIVSKITVVQNAGESPLREWKIDGSDANGLPVGAQAFELNVANKVNVPLLGPVEIKALGVKNHLAAKTALNIYAAYEQKIPAMFVADEKLQTAAQIADKPGDDIPKNFFTRSLNFGGHLFLSVQQAFSSRHSDGMTVRRDPTVELLEQLGETQGVAPDKVRALKEIALGIPSSNPNVTLPTIPGQTSQASR